MFVATHEGWRRVEVLERRTMIDWAEQIKRLVDIDFPEAEKIIKVVLTSGAEISERNHPFTDGTSNIDLKIYICFTANIQWEWKFLVGSH
jgi:hypothetical protein